MHQRGLALRPVDIDRSAAVRVMSGNGHKPRTVGLDSGATATIQRWANRRRETNLGLSPGSPSVISLREKVPLSWEDWAC